MLSDKVCSGWLSELPDWDNLATQARVARLGGEIWPVFEIAGVNLKHFLNGGERGSV